MFNTVLIVDHSLECGGGQISLMTFLKLNSGTSFMLLLNKENKRLINFCNENGIQFYKFNFKSFVFIRFINLILLILRINSGKKISLLYGNTFEAAFWCSLLKIIFKIPFVFRARLAINKFNHGIVDNIIYYFSDKIIANSYFVKSSFIERFGLKAENKIVVIYNPIVPDFEKLVAREKKLENNLIYNIALIGTIEENKGHLIAIKAIEYLVFSLNIKNIKLLIIGNPDLKDNGVYYSIIKEYVLNANLDDNNVAFLGYINNPKEIYDDIDIVLNCHEFEALSRVMFETQLYGIPNIATNSGGNIELISDFYSGLLFTPYDFKDLANKILTLINDKALYNFISRNASVQAVDLFSRINTVDKEIEIINNI